MVDAWVGPEIANSIIAGALGIFGTLVGGTLGLLGSYWLQRKSREDERNLVSYTIFAGLIAVQQFLDDLLERDVQHPANKVGRLAIVDFYWKVFEENLGNLGALGPGEAVMLTGVYADLKIIHGQSASIVGKAE